MGDKGKGGPHAGRAINLKEARRLFPSLEERNNHDMGIPLERCGFLVDGDALIIRDRARWWTFYEGRDDAWGPSG